MIRFARAKLLETPTLWSRSFWKVLRKILASRTGTVKISRILKFMNQDMLHSVLSSPILYYSPLDDSLAFRYAVDIEFAKRYIQQHDKWKFAVPVVGLSIMQLFFGGLGKLVYIPTKFI